MRHKSSNHRHPVTGESIVGAPLAVLSGSIIFASLPTFGIVAVTATAFFAAGVLAVLDNLVLGEDIAKSILHVVSKRSAYA